MSSNLDSELTTCQKCGKNDPNLTKVDSGLRLTLTKLTSTEVPDLVCSGCLKSLKKSASHGAQLQAKEEAKVEQKSDLWKSRLGLVRQGRMFLKSESYAEAAVCYEKYLKVVSIVSEKESKKELDPKLFNENPKELTILSSVLWDLMLIYDSHPKFNSKQMEAAELLAKFLRFSPIYTSVIRKAEIQFSKAKNPPAFKHLLKLCDVQASRCFIANSAFETRTHPTVILLCQFRDNILRQTPLGRHFIAWYYRHSPLWAVFLDQHPRLKSPMRFVLQRVGMLVKNIFNLPGTRDS